MNYSTVYVGMDVHKETFSLCCYTNEKEQAAKRRCCAVLIFPCHCDCGQLSVVSSTLLFTTQQRLTGESLKEL